MKCQDQRHRRERLLASMKVVVLSAQLLQLIVSHRPPGERGWAHHPEHTR